MISTIPFPQLVSFSGFLNLPRNRKIKKGTEKNLHEVHWPWPLLCSSVSFMSSQAMDVFFDRFFLVRKGMVGCQMKIYIYIYVHIFVYLGVYNAEWNAGWFWCVVWDEMWGTSSVRVREDNDVYMRICALSLVVRWLWFVSCFPSSCLLGLFVSVPITTRPTPECICCITIHIYIYSQCYVDLSQCYVDLLMFNQTDTD